MATKKVTTKRTGKKPATKKAKSIKAVQTLRDGFKNGTKKNPLPHVKHNNVAISDVSNEKYPEMVQITLGPAKIMDQIGMKRYVNLDFAIMAIDTAQADALIDTGAKGIKKESSGTTSYRVRVTEDGIQYSQYFNSLKAAKTLRNEWVG